MGGGYGGLAAVEETGGGQEFFNSSGQQVVLGFAFGQPTPVMQAQQTDTHVRPNPAENGGVVIKETNYKLLRRLASLRYNTYPSVLTAIFVTHGTSKGRESVNAEG